MKTKIQTSSKKYCTCIHVSPTPIPQLSQCRDFFPGFCKTVIIEDQAHSPGPATHFVSLKLLKRKNIAQAALLFSSAHTSGIAGLSATWLSRQLSLYNIAANSCLATFGTLPSITAHSPPTPQPTGCCVHPLLHACPPVWWFGSFPSPPTVNSAD